MRFQIKKRYALILALSCAQLLCLCWGVLVFDHWLGNSVRTTMTKQILDDNVETARQMTRLIEETEITDIEQNLESWNRLQSIIKDIRLPNEGYVCVIRDQDGLTLCHPALNYHPLLSSDSDVAKNSSMTKKELMAKQQMMAKKEMAKNIEVDAMAKKKAMMLQQAEMDKKKAMMAKKPPMQKDGSQQITKGEVVVGGQTELVAAASMPEIDAKVYVHQKISGIEAAIRRISVPLRTIGMVVSLILALVSLGVTTAILHRYENKLADLNEELEDLNFELEDLVKERTQSLMNTRNAVIFGLAKLAESRDSDTGDHLDRIRLYVTELAKQLSRSIDTLTPKHIENLGLASSLHDIGKVGIPDHVLLKPGKLEPVEREVIERHPEIGGACLRAISEKLGDDDFLELSREIAYGHHERWDGKGYPYNIAGEQIPLSARIVALADVYDALRSQRPYKNAMSHDKARTIILEGRGTHFDPTVVEAFLACEQRFEDISDFYQEKANERTDPKAIVAELSAMLNSSSHELVNT